MMNARWLVVPMVSMLAACAGEPQAPEQAPTQPHSNLAQLMRAIPFPNSNIIFDTQTTDPAAAADSTDAGAGATATQLFSGTYGGWQAVENAGLALAETANLLLIPGRMCENGQPVPIENEDFRRWTEELAQAGLEAYTSAQSRDLDAMFEVSGTLTEACFNCHERYRDTPNEPADRCMP